MNVNVNHTDPTATGHDKSLFVEQSHVEPYQCPICFNISKKPHETCCGHVFCSDCLSRSLQTNNYCPVCRENLICLNTGATKIHHSLHLQRRIGQFQVQCSNDGCNFVGSLNDYLRNHKENCSFKKIDCPFSWCGCAYRKKTRKQIETHMKICEMEHLWLHSKNLSKQVSECANMLRCQMRLLQEAGQRMDDLEETNSALSRRLEATETEIDDLYASTQLESELNSIGRTTLPRSGRRRDSSFNDLLHTVNNDLRSLLNRSNDMERNFLDLPDLMNAESIQASAPTNSPVHRPHSSRGSRPEFEDILQEFQAPDYTNPADDRI